MPPRTLQKSFSEQDQSASAKPRQHWQRNQSYQGHPSGPMNCTPKVLSGKLSGPVSSSNKNRIENSGHKLSEPKSLENNVGDLLSLDSDKENAAAKTPSVQPVAKEVRRGVERPSSVVGSFKHVPSTPGDKLALPDLTAMADVQRTRQSISPEDRLLWDVRNHATSLRKRTSGKKRARSSSPPPSVPTGVSPQTRTGPEFDIWRSHTISGSDFEHIMQTSSPQQAKDGHTPRVMAHLKRTQSLGNNSYVPVSKRVRRYSPENNASAGDIKHQPSKLSTFIENLKKDLSQSEMTSTTKSTCKQTLPSHTSIYDATPISKRASIKKIKTQRPELESDYSSDDGGFIDLLEESIIDSMELKESTTVTDAQAPVFSHSVLKSPGRMNKKVAAGRAVTEISTSLQTGVARHDEFDDGLSDADFEEALVEKTVSKAKELNSITLPLYDIKEKDKGRTSGTLSDHEFGDDIDVEDFAAAEVAVTQSINQTRSSLRPPPTQKVQKIQRYLVTHVLLSEFEGPYGRSQREKILLLRNEDTQMTKTVHLRGTWIDTPVTVDAYVHIIGTFEKSGMCIIDDVQNLIILHPDHLLSSTVIADSFGCTRRAVLQDRVKATSDPNPSLVYGTVLHEIFQAAMLHNRWDTTWLDKLIEETTTRHVEDLYTVKVPISNAIQHLKSKMGELQSWAELFVSSSPKSLALVQAGNGEQANMCVSKLLDVEEHVWSPMYGLKGNIDATVQVTMKDGRQLRTLTVPFELKTGKTANAAHRAQTALYNLLLSDRYDIDIAYGILYYMETSETIRIPAIRHELRHMIMQRNELACFVRERDAQLPPVLKNVNMCNRCYAKVPCFIYHKLADDGDGQTSGMKAKFDEVVSHLTPTHKQFFLKWDDLLTKEEKESLKFRRELWTMLSSEREKLGRCFSNVIIEPGSLLEEKDNPKINRFRYTLLKQNYSPNFSFLDSQITVGEPIVISDEKGHFALANGYVLTVRKKRIIVAVDRRLHNARIRRPGFNMVNNQVFASIMEVAPSRFEAEELPEKIQEQPVSYRLDKDEFSNGMATVRNNLIQVMAEGPFGSRKIRSLVVDLKEPRFKHHSTQYVLQDRASLNVDQRRAIEKVMSAEDYALVLGMPGTGKTTTIAHIIRALASQGKSVLLTSYTHTAVDNILLKFKHDKLRILRLGSVAKISTEVQEFATLAASSRTSFEDVHTDWHDTPVVATTCLGINHALFNERTFDYCIVDEASQITLPVCVGPIRLAKTFILVGDHNQLPPLVQNDTARLGGLDISLFKYLSDAHPSSVVYLEHQYRMCEDVMALSNNLIYNGRLKCGSREVAGRRLQVPNMEALRNHHHTPTSLTRLSKSATQSPQTICPSAKHANCWLYNILTPSTTISFLNTDALLPSSYEVSRGARLINPLEATLCAQLVLSLLTIGVPATSIGVMTHYRSQLSLLKDSLRIHPEVEMHTADRFQGRDKDVVVLSLVRSNNEGRIGELLRDWRRINVAFTRAKTKLIVVGSKSTLSGCLNEGLRKVNRVQSEDKKGEEEMVARFVKFMEEKHWIYDLPLGAADMHCFDDVGATQTQGSAAGYTRTGVGGLAATQRDVEGVGAKPLAGVKGRKRVLDMYASDDAGQENASLRKHQPKRIRGGKKMLDTKAGSVLGDILNEALGEGVGVHENKFGIA